MEKKVVFERGEYTEHKGLLPLEGHGEGSSVKMDEETYKTFKEQDEKWSGAQVDARQHLSHREAHSEYRAEFTRAIAQYQVMFSFLVCMILPLCLSVSPSLSISLSLCLSLCLSISLCLCLARFMFVASVRVIVSNNNVFNANGQVIENLVMLIHCNTASGSPPNRSSTSLPFLLLLLYYSCSSPSPSSSLSSSSNSQTPISQPRHDSGHH
jgi:hypothetical protein